MSEPDHERSRWAPWAVFACFTLLYGLTACPGVYWYDSAELVAAGVTLGIPHPPGYPLYVWLGYAVTRLPVDPAYAMNLMSAVFAGAAVSLCFSLGRRLGASWPASLIGAAALGLGPVFWDNATIAEVYAPGLAVMLLVWLMVHDALEQRRAKGLVLAAGVAGLGLGLHPFIATVGLGLAFLVLTHGQPEGNLADTFRGLIDRARLAARLGIAALAVLAVAAGASQYLWLLTRAAAKPEVMAVPFEGWEGFRSYATAELYQGLFDAGEDHRARHLSQIGGSILSGAAYLGVPVALVGIAALSRDRARWAVALLLGVLGNVITFFDYHVHDLEVFVLPAIALLCLSIGPGADALIERLEPRIGSRASTGIVLGLLGLSVLATPVMHGFRGVRPNDTSAEDFIAAVESDLPRDAFIVQAGTPQEWERYTVFRFYGQVVRGIRPDVKVVTKPHPAEMVRAIQVGKPIYVFTTLSPYVGGPVEAVPAGPLYRLKLRSPPPLAR